MKNLILDKAFFIKMKKVMKDYRSKYPDIKINRDYFPLKITEEWGECMQAYLMLTDKGRQKGKTKEELHESLSMELADVLGFLFLFAEKEKVDIAEAFEKAWFKHLKS